MLLADVESHNQCRAVLLTAFASWSGTGTGSLICPVSASVQARILQLLPRSANLVRLLAAGQFHYSRAIWQAVLVEPVVKQLEASLPVQQIAQVTFDIAHAVEELAKLMIVHRDSSPNNIGYQDDAHGCHGWLYDFGAAKVGLGQT